MTGQELLTLKDARAFRQPVMDTIINEFEPPEDAFALTEDFMPFKLVDKDVLIDLIKHGAFGRTNPVNLGADHKRIALPGATFKEHTVGHWREAIMFDEEVLQKAVNPQKPTERWGDGLAPAALNVLDLRLNNLIEYVTSKILIDGNYSEARYGINYTYNPNLPGKFYLDVTGTIPYWTTGGTWATVGSALPIADIIGAKNHMANNGLIAEKVIGGINALEMFYNATNTKTMVQSSPALVGRSADREFVFDTLTGLKFQTDARRYAEETVLTAASAATDTTLDVENPTEFAVGDVITLRNTAGQEEDGTISDITNNVITVGAITYAYAIGDRVSVYKPFVPEGYILIKAKNNPRVTPNNWISTPSLVKGKSWTRPLPGRYTWNHFNTRVPYTLEIGAGIDGGPKVSQCTWLRLKIT